MKNKLLILFIFLLLITGCKNNDIPDIVLNTNGYLELDNEIDYSEFDNWINLDLTNRKAVDVLYLYPDSFNTTNNKLISDINDEGMRKNALEYYKNEIGVFTDDCNVYAPYYRQIDFNYLTTLSDEDYDNLLEYISYKDIENFLNYYFEHFNNNKPFILAGDGQGSKLLYYSIKNYLLNHLDYSDNMLVAYLIGTPITYDDIDGDIRFAEFNNDLGVIVSFNTEGPNNNTNNFIRKNTVSINPINWRRDDTYAKKEENLGSMINGKIVMNKVDAKLDLNRGVVITNYDKVSNPEFYGSNSYHNYDYLLFYNNLKNNVRDRINSYYSD